MFEIEFSLTHGKSSSCAGKNSFVASTSVSKAGAVHSFMNVNRPKVEPQLESSFQPNRLPAESKFFATEIFPTRLDRQLAHLVKGKCPLGGETRVEAGHRFAKDQRGQQVNAGVK